MDTYRLGQDMIRLQRINIATPVYSTTVSSTAPPTPSNTLTVSNQTKFESVLNSFGDMLDGLSTNLTNGTEGDPGTLMSSLVKETIQSAGVAHSYHVYLRSVCFSSLSNKANESSNDIIGVQCWSWGKARDRELYVPLTCNTEFPC